MKSTPGKQTDRLSPAQNACVMHGDGPALVLAGPGSGKTRVITMRTLRLITERTEERKDCGRRVLTLAFNKAAAEEMRERCQKMLSKIPPDKRGTADFATVHSFCFQILCAYAEEKQRIRPRVLYGAARENCIFNIYRDIAGENRMTEEQKQRLLAFISRVSGELSGEKTPSDPAMTEQEYCRFSAVYEAFAKLKKKQNRIDFDDMIRNAHALLQSDPDYRTRCAAKYDYIQVDEAQDLSRRQFEVITMLGRGQIFAVADDDQSIYGFRGAEPSLLFEFEKEMPGCKKYLLEENYRSKSEITAAASRFIRENHVRFDKNIFTNNGRGGKIRIKAMRDLEEQAAFLSREIVKLRRKEKGSVCILYRNNISYLCPAIRLTADAARTGNTLPDIHTKPDPSVASVLPVLFRVALEARKREKRFSGIYIPELPAILREMEQEGCLEKLLFSSALSGKGKFFSSCVRAAVRILFSAAGNGEKAIGILRRLSAYGSAQEEAPQRNAMEDGIFFSTVHSAKGLEFDHVFIVDALEGEFPAFDEEIPSRIEEERRLFYVALTRAKKSVSITYPKKSVKNSSASRFVTETKTAMKA